MTQQTTAQLRKLSLSGMARALSRQLEQIHSYEDLPFLERLDLLIDHELQCRSDRKQKRLLRQAELKLHATMPDVDYHHRRGLDKSQLMRLAQCDWLRRAENLLITGPCGCGKTYIGCALGHQACLLGHSSRYRRLSRLLLEMRQARIEDRYAQKLAQLGRFRLLIIDDWGLQPLGAAERGDLIEIFDDRYMRASTVIISQLPVDQWHATIGDNTLADAILDRLIHNSHRIALDGESMRREMAPQTDETGA